MQVLMLNAGSSSLKAVLMESEQEVVLASGHFDWSKQGVHYKIYLGSEIWSSNEIAACSIHDAVVRVVEDLKSISISPVGGLKQLSAVGHRIVHGGEYSSSVAVNRSLLNQFEQLSRLAPLHNPRSLEVIQSAQKVLSDVPHFATFDSAFHSTLPEYAKTYPVPRSWRRDWGIRRYGFHGLSHSYCSLQAQSLLKRSGHPSSRLVICHLGNGCSATAVQDGRSIDTTMGFTPLDGLMMGSRCGSIDPGILIHVMTEHQVTVSELNQVLNCQSGLFGLSRVSSDMRAVLTAAESGNEEAGLAVDVYIHRLRQTIGSLCASLGGLDALVFTAGVGENSTLIRERVCTGMEFIGISLDADRNHSCQPDVDIATQNSRVRILVIATREELMMCREVVKALKEYL